MFWKIVNEEILAVLQEGFLLAWKKAQRLVAVSESAAMH